MTDKQIHSLSRRQLLGGVGAIGVASAGAGLGTTAYFSDEESFDDNTLSAGELDLLVDYELSYDQGSAGSGGTSGTINGDVQVVDENGDDVAEGDAVSLTLDDVKPGDSGGAEFCFRIIDNPAYLWLNGELTVNDENGYTEPEPETDSAGDVNDPGASDGAGELADSIEATLYYEGDDPANGVIVEGTLTDVLSAASDGVLLDGDGTYGVEAGEQAPFDGGEDADNPCIYLDWEIPVGVGNEIQTDLVEFEFSFYAEQSRHNDGTNNPYSS